MADTNTTGISDPDRPGQWLVPPWPENATFCEIAGYFSERTPLGGESRASHYAFYHGFQKALESARPDQSDDHWRADLLRCITQCADNYRRSQPLGQLRGQVPHTESGATR
ncbi:hypothetical protein EV193_103508 [Herbihabitans rhizosphaerae]|uniref:Uncharacterized protein n=1 Tax=Herbihabitans rhizosphaerae TaxID=1872711 RepID=A0A4Q7KVV5_9PSEU|nr:hypothetical protein EV193_103508 [Herbihabitans rhizosphaerae]